MNLWGIGAILIALAALVFGVNKWESKIETRGYNKAQAEQNERAVTEQAKQRKIESDRQKRQQEAQDAAQINVETARADAARANSAAAGLRKRLAEISNNRGTGINLTASAERATASAIGDILGECGERYSGVAKEADGARNAGQLCERLYDALSTPIADKVRALGK